MKASKQRFVIELIKELRETINAYDRKLKKLAPIVDHLEDNEIAEFRRIIYDFIGPLQSLEQLKHSAQNRAKSVPRHLHVVK